MPEASRRPLSREEALRAVPVRNPKAKYVRAKEGGRIEMAVTVMGGSWLARLFGKGTPEERTRRMDLDATGAFCWEQFDGERTVEEAAKALAERDDLGTARAEESLWSFLRILSQRGLVALSAPKPPDAGGDAGPPGSG